MTTETLDATQATGAETQADAVTEPDDAELDAVLTAIDGTQAAPVTESATAGTESDDPELEVIRTAAREEGERQAAERLRIEHEEREVAMEAERNRAAIKQAFDNTAPALRSFLEQKGLEGADINPVLETFSSFRAQAEVLAMTEMAREIEKATASLLPDATSFREEQENLRRQGRWTASALIKSVEKHLTDKATKGTFTQAQKDAEVVMARRKLLAEIRKNPDILNSMKAPSNGNNSNTSSSHSQKSEADILMNGPIEEVAKILARQGR